MVINLLQEITINISTYQQGAGWEVSTNIPDELVDKPMMVQLETWYYDENFDCHESTSTIEVNTSFFLDDIIAEIVQYIRSLSEEDQEFFEDNCYLEELILDTETMVASTAFGS